jgi:predicted ATPase/DNA-binding winged helix-turn-helix (wHTH) protein
MSDFGSYRFERWELHGRDRVLACAGEPVKLGGRAYDVLLALVERCDRVVAKNELMDLVWPKLVVEENNLQVHVAALRKLLGHPAIVTVPGRGYRFTMPVQRETAAVADTAASAATPAPPHPAPADELIGREDDIALLEQLLQEHPVVTVCGAGGIGKTRLARAAAARLDTVRGSRVWWVELGPLSEATRVAHALMQALGAQPGPNRSATEAAALALRNEHGLVVLDNAEHLLDAVAELIDELRRAAPQTRWLVTSQEPLHLADEQQFKLGPLTLPDASVQQTPAAVAASGAGALFAARCRALDARFEIDHSNAATVADICRRLDGIALAIELAVARVPLLGVQGLRARLDERFSLLTAGARAVLRKHQTLRAALAWSHDLLSPAEQCVFRRLGVFAGGFTLDAAQRVADDDKIDGWDVVEHLGALVDKSLVLADGAQEPRYRMLETTRLYAIERLAEAGETATLLERHARALVDRMAIEEDDDRRRRSMVTGDAALIAEVDNARAALAWAATGHDDALAAQAAWAAFFPMCAARLLPEYVQAVLPLRRRVSDAVPARVAAHFWLRLAIAGLLPAIAESGDAAERAVRAFRALGDEQALFDALGVRIAIGSRRGEVEAVRPCVEEARALAHSHFRPQLLSQFNWAVKCWYQMQGRWEEALALVQESIEQSRRWGSWNEHIMQAARAVIEISLGRAEEAEQRARAALAALDALGHGADSGHVICVLVLALAVQGRADEALALGRRARTTLERIGDETRLLEPLALAAADRGRAADAACTLGCYDSRADRQGEVVWQSHAIGRDRLDARLAEALGVEALREHLERGRGLDLDRAFALAFGDAVQVTAAS